MWQIFLVFACVFSEWTSLGKPNNSHLKFIELNIAVKQTNLDILEETLLNVSTPRHEDYGKHLTTKEVHDLIKPDPSSLDAIIRFFPNFEIEHTTPNSDFLKIKMSLEQAGALLNGTYHEFQHKSGLKAHRISGSYSIPEGLRPHVDFIAPTTLFPPTGLKVKIHDEPSTVGHEVTPDFLIKLYNVTENLSLDSNSSMAIASFLEQYYSKTDLAQFWTKYGIKVTDVEDVPKTQPHGNGIEAELDIQYITAMGQGISTEVWYTNGRMPDSPDNEPFLDWLTKLSTTVNPPDIFSISYGEPENTVPFDYASRVNVEFQKAGVRGISLLIASGDSGVGCAFDAFEPNFPVSSPWITGVGGTEGGNSGIFSSSESCALLSGGGFSNWWPVPDYQKNATEYYLKNAMGLPKKRYYNHTSRGFPDVSAQAMDFTIIANGQVMPGVAGTSAAAPTFSGIIALLNGVRRKKSGSNLGFLNPLIYEWNAMGNVLNDITDGGNEYCGAAGGFPASKGWDPATGVGTPNLGKMIEHIESL